MEDDHLVFKNENGGPVSSWTLVLGVCTLFTSSFLLLNWGPTSSFGHDIVGAIIPIYGAGLCFTLCHSTVYITG